MKEKTDPLLSLRASTEYHRPSNRYWQQRQRLADALRRFGNLLLSRAVPEAELSALANQLEHAGQRATTLPEIPGRKGWLDAGFFSDPDALSTELSPLIGKSSMMGPPLRVWIEHGEARAEAFCDWRFEGPPHCVHGGYIAAMFDEFLGWTQMLSGGSGATKTLQVTYHKPTPLNTLLVFTARLASVDGRKIRVTGDLQAAGQVTASAEGLFISFGDKGTTELYKNL